MDDTTTKKKKEPVIHTDILGQELIEGCYVAAPRSNAMYICKVTKLNPKMIRIVNAKKSAYRSDVGWLVYPNETVRLTGEEAMAYILKYA